MRSEHTDPLIRAVVATMASDEHRFIARLITTGITPAAALTALAARDPELVARARRMAEELVAEMEITS